MASQLLQPAGRGKWTSRTTAVAAITVGHIAVIAAALLVRGPQPDVEHVEPIMVSLLTEQRSEPPPAPPQPPRPEEIVLPQAVLPLINIDVPQEAAPPITVAVTPSPPAPPTPPVSVGDTSEPIMATSVEYVRPPVATYPPAARQARVSGTVYVRALVETDGRVRDVRVQRSSGYASLDKAASESVLGALFRPYMRDGIARAALVIVPVDFSLKVRGGRRDKGQPPQDGCGKPHHPGRERDDEPCAEE